jgi:WD40 repeat protein
MSNYLEIEGNIGINCRSSNCMVIHPSELHMVFAVGSLIVVKSVEHERDRYLYGHTARVNYITISNNGNLMGSAETQDIRTAEQAALIVWDFNSLEILYRVKYHKQCVRALSFSCNEGLLASIGGKQDGNQLVVWNMDEGKSEIF